MCWCLSKRTSIIESQLRAWPKLWNQLPVAIGQSNSVDSFKRDFINKPSLSFTVKSIETLSIMHVWGRVGYHLKTVRSPYFYDCLQRQVFAWIDYHFFVNLNAPKARINKYWSVTFSIANSLKRIITYRAIAALSNRQHFRAQTVWISTSSHEMCAAYSTEGTMPDEHFPQWGQFLITRGHYHDFFY